ncbi:hypothetical protein FRB99_001738 [Tulasnella sp. 403]|nr:hypothetical protein FRB99_001738 [Tulasnella sp. 403]
MTPLPSPSIISPHPPLPTPQSTSSEARLSDLTRMLTDPSLLNALKLVESTAISGSSAQPPDESSLAASSADTHRPVLPTSAIGKPQDPRLVLRSGKSSGTLHSSEGNTLVLSKPSTTTPPTDEMEIDPPPGKSSGPPPKPPETSKATRPPPISLHSSVVLMSNTNIPLETPITALPTTNFDNSGRELWKIPVKELGKWYNDCKSIEQLQERRKNMDKLQAALDKEAPSSRYLTLRPPNHNAERVLKVRTEIDEKISSFSADMESRVTAWATERSSYFPFEPQDGRVPTEKEEEEERKRQAELDHLMSDLEQMSNSLQQIRAELERLQKDAHTELATAPEPTPPSERPSVTTSPEIASPMDMGEDTPFSDDEGSLSEVEKELLEGLETLQEGLRTLKGRQQSFKDEVNLELELAQQDAAMPSVIVAEPDVMDLDASANGDGAVIPNGTVEAGALTKAEFDKLRQSVDTHMVSIAQYAERIKDLEQQARFTADVGHLQRSNEYLAQQVAQLEKEDEEESNRVEALQKAFFEQLDIISPPNPPQLPTFEEVVASIADPVAAELHKLINEQLDGLSRDIDTTGTEIEDSFNLMLKPARDLMHRLLDVAREGVTGAEA